LLSSITLFFNDSPFREPAGLNLGVAVAAIAVAIPGLLIKTIKHLARCFIWLNCGWTVFYQPPISKCQRWNSNEFP